MKIFAHILVLVMASAVWAGEFDGEYFLSKGPATCSKTVIVREETDQWTVSLEKQEPLVTPKAVKAPDAAPEVVAVTDTMRVEKTARVVEGDEISKLPWSPDDRPDVILMVDFTAIQGAYSSKFEYTVGLTRAADGTALLSTVQTGSMTPMACGYKLKLANQ